MKPVRTFYISRIVAGCHSAFLAMTLILAVTCVLAESNKARGALTNEVNPSLVINKISKSASACTAMLTLRNPSTNLSSICGLYFTTNVCGCTSWTRLPYLGTSQSINDIQITNLSAASGFFRVAPTAVRMGFEQNILPGNDDGYTGLVPIGFPINFYGSTYENVYANNNGNITFTSSLTTYTPEPLTSLSEDIIAAFWADIDTQSAGSSSVTYGPGLVDERLAFGVNWINVGYYSSKSDKLNSIQLVLIKRSDRGVGDFDLEFNYAQVQWETGDIGSTNNDGLGGPSARTGFASTTDVSFELEGSGTAGSFVDSNKAQGLIYNSFNSPVLGRYLYQFHNGAPLALP